MMLSSVRGLACYSQLIKRHTQLFLNLALQLPQTYHSQSCSYSNRNKHDASPASLLPHLDATEWKVVMTRL